METFGIFLGAAVILIGFSKLPMLWDLGLAIVFAFAMKLIFKL